MLEFLLGLAMFSVRTNRFVRIGCMTALIRRRVFVVLEVILCCCILLTIRGSETLRAKSVETRFLSVLVATTVLATVMTLRKPLLDLLNLLGKFRLSRLVWVVVIRSLWGMCFRLLYADRRGATLWVANL